MRTVYCSIVNVKKGHVIETPMGIFLVMQRRGLILDTVDAHGNYHKIAASNVLRKWTRKAYEDRKPPFLDVKK